MDQRLLSLLPKTPVFGGIDGAALERIAGLLKLLELAADEVVVRQGENGRSLFLVLEGEVIVCQDVTGRRRKLCRLKEGELFGEMCLVEIQPRSATVITERPTKLLSLTQKDLQTLYEKDLPTYALLMGNIARELSRRLRRADERLMQLAAKAGDDEQTQIRQALNL
jgi:CRP/FNR family transcriptional regulator, cyclic AMP receptor protein